MFCQKCGTPLDGSTQYCTTCGAPITVQPAPGAQGYAPYGTPATDAFGYAPASNTAYEPNNPFVYAPPADAMPAPKKKSAKKIIIPIVAVVVAAAVAFGTYFGFFANKKYYISTMTIYEYDEDGDVIKTTKLALYDKFMVPLETEYEDDYNNTTASTKYTLDDDNKIIEYSYKYESDDEEHNESYSIDIEYEKEDGKQVGTGSHKNDDGEKETIKIVYESDDSFTITKKTDGELDEKYTCYINDDGYTVTEEETPTYKSVEIYDGINIIEEKSYSRDDEDDKFELTYSKTCEYNKHGHVIEMVEKTYYDDETTTYKTVYERNKHNVPTSITKYEDGEKVGYTEIDEENDDSIVLELFDDDDETVGFIEIGFKGKKLTYIKTYNEDHDLTNEVTYNKNGLPEEMIYYNSYGDKTSKIIIEYEKR